MRTGLVRTGLVKTGLVRTGIVRTGFSEDKVNRESLQGARTAVWAVAVRTGVVHGVTRGSVQVSGQLSRRTGPDAQGCCREST